VREGTLPILNFAVAHAGADADLAGKLNVGSVPVAKARAVAVASGLDTCQKTVTKYFEDATKAWSDADVKTWIATDVRSVVERDVVVTSRE